MAYTPNKWVDREGITRYFESVDDDGALILTPDYTQVTEIGTPVNSDNMNHIEEGIAAGSFTKYDSKTTYAKDDLVTAIVDGELKVYKSLQDNNHGQALAQTAYWVEVELGSGGGLEIGDIGIAPLGIDETKGKRRYLNGQLIIQEQYIQFTNKVKSAVALYPSLACTESEWQTTATMTVGGQVGKFVVDDDAGTIRLPKIIMPIQGLTDLSKLAEIVEAGSPNITGIAGGVCGGGTFSGAFTEGNKSGTIGSGAGSHYNISFDASKSNPIYGNSDTVQQEQIQYPYFIQVATGAETEDNIINEIELNNPYTLFDSKYSPNALYNASWLKSEGQYNSGVVYVTCYEGLLVEYNTEIEVGTTTTLPSGTEYTKKGLSVKLVTEEYTDYDWVLNTAEETFRLPLLDGSEDLLSDRVENLTLLASDSTYIAPANGWYNLHRLAGITNGGVSIDVYNENQDELIFYTEQKAPTANSSVTISAYCKRGQVVKIGYDATGTIKAFRFIYAQGNGSLYYYVGETVQNANLINAGRIQETYTTKSMVDGQWVKSYKEVSSATAVGKYTIDLSDYLPNDGYMYEVLAVTTITNNANGTNSYLYLASDLIAGYLMIGSDTNLGGVGQYNSSPLPVMKILTYEITGQAPDFAAARLYGYRRLGTNV